MEKFSAAFKANAGIKDIVGRGLIYDDNIALIELVKNSKDAGSNQVIVSFNHVNEKKDDLEVSEIVITDHGKGMTRDEVVNKWLNIAYSEKKNSTRSKFYAGNKGVGRFSCDRLGEELTLYTKSKDGEYIKLPIIWSDFEGKGPDDEVSSISLVGQVIDKVSFLKEVRREDFITGTVLKIKKIRSAWGEEKLKKLISELGKFSPDIDDEFEVYLESNVEFKTPDLNKQMNSKIDNAVLGRLAFKTTYITGVIDKDGETIEVKVYYHGDVVYSYKAENPYSNLKSISIEVHYLDTIAKSYFTRNIGINPNSYGSVFLFYNGFRVSPYGNEKNDWLGLDQRKSQGTSRYLGTRDVIGRIDIVDADDKFSVVTSREGLAHNGAFLDLFAYDQSEKTTLKNKKKEYGFATVLIRQLESFVVNGLDWNRLVDNKGELKIVPADTARKDSKRFSTKKIDVAVVSELLGKGANSNFKVSEYLIDKEVVNNIQKINEEKYNQFIDEFMDKTDDKLVLDLSSRDKGVVRKIVAKERQQKEQALESKVVVEKELVINRQLLEAEKKKGQYLLSTRKALSDDADGLIHTIKINNVNIIEATNDLLECLTLGVIDEKNLLDKLSNIKLYSLKTMKMTELATRSTFDRDIDIRSVDLTHYIKEYIEIFKDAFEDDYLDVKYENITSDFVRSISVLNLSIIIDNLMSNSVKWGGSLIKVSFSMDEDKLIIDFSDNGVGVVDEVLSCSSVLFELGVRYEPPGGFGGSGVGLYYSRKLLQEMNASIEFVGNDVDLSGALFRLTFE